MVCRRAAVYPGGAGLPASAGPMLASTSAAALNTAAATSDTPGLRMGPQRRDPATATREGDKRPTGIRRGGTGFLRNGASGVYRPRRPCRAVLGERGRRLGGVGPAE